MQRIQNMRFKNQLFARAIIAAQVFLLLFTISSAHAEVQLTLKNSFIKKYKDRATVEASCVVDETKGKANSASKDGDMHIAVRCADEIALPLVAELMNAKDYKDVRDATVIAKDSGSLVKIAGAWRIWNEHGGDNTRFVQGESVSKATSTNPDHVFEIHPISQFGNVGVLDSFKIIDGYTPKEPDAAFSAYENSRAKITRSTGVTTITSNGVGYNYVKFQMELSGQPFPVKDGSFAFAKVRDWSGELLLRKKRMVFVKGTPPELAVRDAGAGTCLRVLGIPRLDLALVAWRTAQASKGRIEVLDWNLPYEIIVVGLYDTQCEQD
jgi:hypothetical protein